MSSYFAYDPPVFRPPSEAMSTILQLTLGCSFNRCSFCSMYRSKDFRVRSVDEVDGDISALAALEPRTTKVFLADGDALGVDTSRLVAVLDHLKSTFPDLRRVSTYATPLNIKKKTDAELQELRNSGLELLYVGLESGSDRMLKRITKGANSALIQSALDRAHGAGMRVSATVILGLGGSDDWKEHIDGTIECVNQAPPRFLSTLQLGIEDVVDTEFHEKQRRNFPFQDDRGMLLELERLLDGLNPPRPVIFRSNHASNALALAGNLPRDSSRLADEVRMALKGDRPLRPDWTRGY